jgi:hypothetical protein
VGLAYLYIGAVLPVFCRVETGSRAFNPLAYSCDCALRRTPRFSLLQARVNCVDAQRIASLIDPHFSIGQTIDTGRVYGTRGFAYQPLPFLIPQINIGESHAPLFNSNATYSTFELGLRF